ncbi:hypothetical protein RJ639_027301 [Escallonia herrerae]|uniref:Uncharacterized protein n=1 Tax=Escallonia herrerae TaxID=1293975 RepID=A0AA89BEZ0_9ASTE|nr:hypothetical protein RJ639_027301 [Escallonia herrerae]
MRLLPCPLSYQPNEESESQSNSNHFHSESSNSFISPQSSLPSVPSLTSSSSQQLDQTSTTHHHCISTLKGHSSYVFSLALAGKHLYSGASNSEIRVWSRNPSSPECSPCSVVSSSKSAVKSLVVLGDRLISAHQDHKIRVWKINGAPYQQYTCMVILPTLNDRVVKLFSAKNYVQVRRHKKCTWVHHVDTVSALALSKDDSLLYSASWDRTFKVWQTSDFKCLESVQNAHEDAINAIALSNSGFVYTGSADRKIKVWKKHEGDKRHTLVATLEKHRSAVNALALSTDGSVLYSGACDRSIIVWEKDVGGGGDAGGGGGHMAVAGALRGHTKAILCLAVLSDLVCSGSADKTVRIWRRGVGKSYSCLAVLEGHRGPVKCLTAAVDSCNNNGSGTSYLVYSGSLDCDIKIWQIWVPFL